jgi:hypothetical protein
MCSLKLIADSLLFALFAHRFLLLLMVYKFLNSFKISPHFVYQCFWQHSFICCIIPSFKSDVKSLTLSAKAYHSAVVVPEFPFSLMVVVGRITLSITLIKRYSLKWTVTRLKDPSQDCIISNNTFLSASLQSF